ncbi:hypothetical protein XNW1_3090001 [Xenorhabdus nematophila str. Websteri]|nr:hypothetical protein XNW1_3090001 [Xenorhabdus nematophila str. Websteri]
MLKNTPYIIFDAEPFCFGPISTTLNVVEQLKHRNKLASDTSTTAVNTISR